MGSLSELVVRLCEMPLTEHNAKLFNELSGFVSPPSEGLSPTRAERKEARRDDKKAELLREISEEPPNTAPKT